MYVLENIDNKLHLTQNDEALAESKMPCIENNYSDVTIADLC